MTELVLSNNNERSRAAEFTEKFKIMLNITNIQESECKRFKKEIISTVFSTVSNDILYHILEYLDCEQAYQVAQSKFEWLLEFFKLLHQKVRTVDTSVNLKPFNKDQPLLDQFYCACKCGIKTWKQDRYVQQYGHRRVRVGQHGHRYDRELGMLILEFTN